MSLAAIAAGADGLIIEVHAHPEAAWSDGARACGRSVSLHHPKRPHHRQVIGRDL